MSRTWSLPAVLAPLSAISALLISVTAQAGLNAGATARLYWQVGTQAGLSERNSTAATPQLVVTVTGLKSFRGADIQLTLNGCTGALPPAWRVVPGECAEAAGQTWIGGRGGTVYRNAFTTTPAVTGLATSQNGMYFQYMDNPCIAPDSTGTLWLSSAGAAGAARDSTVEYAIFAFKIDLSGASAANGVSCRGDLADSAGPLGVEIAPNYHMPCDDIQRGPVLAVIDANAEVDYIPFESGTDSLRWECEESASPSLLSVSPRGLFPNQKVWLTLQGRALADARLVALTNVEAGIRLIADSLSTIEATSLRANFSIPSSVRGPLDLHIKTSVGSDSLVSAVKVTDPPTPGIFIDGVPLSRSSPSTERGDAHSSGSAIYTPGCTHYPACAMTFPPSVRRFRGREGKLVDVPPFKGDFIAHGKIGFYFGTTPNCDPFWDPDCAVKNVPVAIQVFPVELSGYHYHAADLTRPTGRPSRGEVFVGNTGVDGLQFVPTFEWPEVCSKLDILFYCTADTCVHWCDRDTFAVICIRDTLGKAATDGLVLLPDDTTLYRKHDTAQDQQVRHPAHLYGTHEMIDSIRAAAREIKERFPQFDSLLVVNDISLPWGGVFDFVDAGHPRPPDWTPPHGGHRFGIEADFRDWNMGHTRGLRDAVRRIMRHHGLIPNGETGHIHVTLKSLSRNG